MANTIAGKIYTQSGQIAGAVYSCNLVSDYGAIGNGIADDTTAFMNCQAELLAIQAASANPVSFLITTPYGRQFTVTNNRWMWGLRNFVVDFQGSTYQNINSTGINENMYPIYLNRNSFETSSITQFPQSGYVPGYLLTVTANPGDKQLTVSTSDSANFTVGKWILIYSYDQEFSDQPPNCAFMDYVQVTAVNTGTGVVSFSGQSLEYLHSITYPDVSTAGGLCGRARAAVIDRSDIPFILSATIKNMTILKNPNIASSPASYGSQYLLGVNAYSVTLENVTAPSFSPSCVHDFTVKNCTLLNCEVDKLIVKGTFIGSSIDTTSDAQSCRQIEIIGCDIKSTVYYNPKVLRISGGRIGGVTDTVYNSGSFPASIGMNLMSASGVITIEGTDLPGKLHYNDTIWSGQNLRNVTIDGATITLTNNYTLSGPVSNASLQRFVSAAQVGCIVLANAGTPDANLYWGQVRNVYGGTSNISMDISFNRTIPAGAILTAYPIQSLSIKNCYSANWLYGVNGQANTVVPFRFVPHLDYEDRIVAGASAVTHRYRIDTTYGTNQIIEVYGTLQTISINVIRAYTGTDTSPTVSILNTGTGSPSLTEVVALGLTGIRTMSNTATTGSQTGDTLVNLASQYVQQLIIQNSNSGGGAQQLSGATQLQAIYEVIITTLPDLRTMLQ